MRFLLSARAVKAGAFTAEPGPSLYLQFSDSGVHRPSDAIEQKAWLRAVRKAAVWGKDARTGAQRGDLVFFVHGYNNAPTQVSKRHQLLQQGLNAQGFKGVVVSFDWPADNQTLNYVEDRHDAKKTAMQLVSDGIALLAQLQEPNCTINIHVLAHSMGAFVVREAFDDADDARLAQQSWLVSQLILVAGDISQNSLAIGNATTESLYRHCIRLTSYFSHFDFALKISNAKRIGLAPRVGRVGLPLEVPEKAVNVSCGDYFASLKANFNAAEQSEPLDDYGHAWYFANAVFMRDLFETLKGDFDRNTFPTRVPNASAHGFALRPPLS
jgi:pimeloyl-ACP methyl ester carboxylesterase